MKDQILSDTVIAHIFYVCQIIQLLMFPQAERLYMYMQMEKEIHPLPPRVEVIWCLCCDMGSFYWQHLSISCLIRRNLHYKSIQSCLDFTATGSKCWSGLWTRVIIKLRVRFTKWRSQFISLSSAKNKISFFPNVKCINGSCKR